MIALLRGLRDLAIPPRCADCGSALCEHEDALCATCASRIPWLPADRCTHCQEEAPAAHAGERCSRCAAAPSALHACLASASYEGECERWIRRFKYPSAGLGGLDARPEAVVRSLAREAAHRAPEPRPDLVVPIPLHPRRLRHRGFNPAALLARHIARAKGARVAPTALRRLRDTPSQTGLGRRQRRRNVAEAFACKRPMPPRIWLVDDVVTTGATLEEAARVLKRAGARHVTAICAARTPAPR